MRIVRIEQTLERCEEHLSSSSAYGTEIESLLTQKDSCDYVFRV